MQESINYRLFLLLWSIWRPAVLTLWQIIVLPLDDPTFLFCLRDIQVCHMKAVLFLYPLLDLLICSTLLKAGHIHVFEREFHSDILSRYISLGKLDYRLDPRRQEYAVDRLSQGAQLDFITGKLQLQYSRHFSEIFI